MANNYLNIFSTKSVKIPITSLDSLYSQLTNIKAVYAVELKKKIIYVGKADHLRNRWSNHHRSYDFNLLLDLGIDLDFIFIESINFEPFSTKDFEKNLINELKPVLNYRVGNYCSFDEILDKTQKSNKEWMRDAINCIKF
tara:strand:+ start:468 stop:887 length:420 start_codon:yes stop_codon:yes gene_type:complete